MSGSATAYAFSGAVRCERRGTQWLLDGLERTTLQPLRLVLVTNDAAALPASMPDLELQRMGASSSGAAPLQWQLGWIGGRREIVLRSIHVQRAGSKALAAAMPGVSPSRRGRLAWALLLNLARVPGVSRLLQALRGAG
jgi:hypothetical protein